MPTRLNLGCGLDYRPGWVNIDARNDVGADIVADIAHPPLPFTTESVSEVLAQDIIEHITLEEQGILFTEIFRILKPQSIFQVRLPDIDDIITRFSHDPETRNLFLYGDTSQSGAWGSHKSGHTALTFTSMAVSKGFRLISCKKIDTNFLFTFKKTNTSRFSRIAFINQTTAMGGAESFNQGLLTWLNSQGIRIDAWTNFHRFHNNLIEAGIPSRQIPLLVDIIGDWKGLLKGLLLLPVLSLYYMFILYKLSPGTVILMTGFIEKILVTPLAKILGFPIVWIEFAPLQTVFSKFLGLPKLLYCLVSGLPDRVVVPTHFSASALIPDSGIPSARLKIVPCAVTVPSGVSDKPVPGSVVCVSRLEPGKGQDVLLRAWPTVLRRHPWARLSIIGEGDNLYPLQSIAKELNIYSSVSFLGWVQDVYKYISQAQVVVFPSNFSLEGFGMVTAEAMALGRPVVAFAAGPTPELIDDKTGILIKNGDTKALSEAINLLLTNPDLALKLGVAARRKFESNFSFSVIGPRYQEVLNESYSRYVARKMMSQRNNG